MCLRGAVVSVFEHDTASLGSNPGLGSQCAARPGAHPSLGTLGEGRQGREGNTVMTRVSRRAVSGHQVHPRMQIKYLFAHRTS